MRHLLALDWDTHEVRLAIAQRRGGRLVLEHAVAIPRTLPPGEVGQATTEDVAGSVADTLAGLGVARPRTLVAVSRASVELNFMSLPPAPPDDLPEMVRFQAQKEFSALTDDWPLDFLPLKGGREEPHELLAAAVAPEVLTQVLDVCRSAGLKPRHAGLRPCAAASLLLRDQTAGNAPIRLLIDLLEQEAELTAIADQRVVFIRTVRLPARTESEEQREARRRLLEAETRRTIAAVHNQLGGSRVDVIYLCSDGQDKSDAAARLEQRLEIPTRVFDPLNQIVLGGELRTARPEHAARFAPLVGMLLDDAERVAPAIDFLHPRKTVQRKEQWKIATLAAVAVVLIITFFGVRTWKNLRAMDAKIATVRNQVNGLQGLIKQTASTQKKVEQLDRWMKSDVDWLDELDRLTKKLPKAENAMLTSLQLVPDASGGSLLLQGRVDNYQTLDQLETQLRDARHRIDPKLSQQDGADPRYPWLFKASLTLLPGNPKQLKQLPTQVANAATEPPASTPPSTPPPTTDRAAAKPASTEASTADRSAAQSPAEDSTTKGPEQPAAPKILPAAVGPQTSENGPDNNE